MVTQPNTLSDTSIPQPPRRNLRWNWDNEDPATPALIQPMFLDYYSMPLEEKPDALWHDPKFQEALKVAEEYLVKFIKQTNETSDVLTMAEMGTAARHFIDGYMACSTGNIELL